MARETVFANLTTAVSVFAGAVFLREPLNRTGLLCWAVILPGICGVRHGSRQEAA